MRLVEGVADVVDLEAFLADLDAVAGAHGVAVQAFDARYVVDREHLALAVELADRAFERGNNIARDRAVEILLFAAGRRQINRALEIGVEEGRREVVVVVDGAGDDGDGGGGGDGDRTDGGGDGDRADGGGDRGDENSTADEDAAAAAVADLLEPAETLGRFDPELVRDYYDVGDAELDAVEGGLPDLVRERVALLVVER
ncbi:MAG: KEOPS complex subunit Cgi121 [Salinigranum sp.]